MPRRYTMSSLVARCKKRCDMATDDSISDTEWKELIDEVYAELWAEVSGTGRRYFETSTTITADGSASYSEPEGHMGTVRVARVDRVLHADGLGCGPPGADDDRFGARRSHRGSASGRQPEPAVSAEHTDDGVADARVGVSRAAVDL